MKKTAKHFGPMNVRMVLILVGLVVTLTSHAQVFRNLFLPKEYIAYQGYETAMCVRNFSVQSDIPELRKLRVQQVGASVGMVFMNHLGKIRPSVGLYYSDANVPHTIDQAEVSVASNLYFMRLVDDKFRFIEPYAIASMGYHRMKFFGTYLSEGSGNMSMASEPALGTIDLGRVSAGVGVELQLVDDSQQFIHLFAEVLTGFATRTHSSRSEFMHTSLKSTSKFAIGISVGLAKF